MQMYVTEFGIFDSPGEPPSQEQIELCKRWLAQFAEPGKRINWRSNSYMCKHDVEAWANTYVANGAFIQAAIDSGFRWRRASNTSHNAEFAMKIRRERG